MRREKIKSEFSNGVGNIVIPLKGDNQGSITLAHNQIFYSKTKHIDIQHYYIYNEVISQKIQLSYMPTEEIIANGFTKALTYIKFHYFIEQIDMT